MVHTVRQEYFVPRGTYGRIGIQDDWFISTTWYKYSSLIVCAPSCPRILQTMWVFERPVDIYIAFQATVHTCFCNAMM